MWEVDSVKEEIELLKNIKRINEIKKKIRRKDIEIAFLMLLSVFIIFFGVIGGLILLDNYFRGIQSKYLLAITTFFWGYFVGFMVSDTIDVMIRRRDKLMEELGKIKLKLASEKGVEPSEIEEVVG